MSLPVLLEGANDFNITIPVWVITSGGYQVP
jgi:hypothetical protein